MDFVQKLRVLVFIEFIILIFIMICRQKRTYLNPGTSRSAEPSLLNSRTNFWTALLTLNTGKKVEEKFRTRWNVHHALGALDGETYQHDEVKEIWQ